MHASWSVNEQATDDNKRVTLDHVDDEALECFSGVARSALAKTTTLMSTSASHTAVSSTQSLDVFVQCADGLERLCRPSDRILVSMGHLVSVVNVKTKDGPQLLYLANHTTRQEYRPRYTGSSLLAVFGGAAIVVTLLFMGIGHFLLPKAWVDVLGHSRLADNLAFGAGALLVLLIVKWVSQMNKETTQRVDKFVKAFSERCKTLEPGR